MRELGDEPLRPRRLLEGHQLMGLGATAGPMVGQLGEELYMAQLEEQVKGKAEARKWVTEWWTRHGEG